jgi:opacity protein-like surface antigen
MSFSRGFLYPLTIVVSAFAIAALAIAPVSAQATKPAPTHVVLPKGAHVVKVSGLPAGDYLVRSITPPPASFSTRTRSDGSAFRQSDGSVFRPDTGIEAFYCTDGGGAVTAIKLYLYSILAIMCVEFAGEIAIGPMVGYFCSGNNIGIAYTLVQGVMTDFVYSGAGNIPEYYWYQTEGGDMLPFNITDLQNQTWSGDAEC